MAIRIRNSFARETIVGRRITVDVNGQTCEWCGSVRQRTETSQPWLYQFMVESDGGSTGNINGLYCSRSCVESFIGRNLDETR